MNKLNLFLLSFFLIAISMKGQYNLFPNLVQNGSFENRRPNASNPNSPQSYGEGQDQIKDWDGLTGGSPDWFWTGSLNEWYDPTSTTYNGGNNFGPGPFSMTAHSGTHYIGFGPCESIKTKLTQQINSGNWVKVGFWYSTRCQTQTQINVYIGPNEPTAAINCTNPGISSNIVATCNVNSLGANPDLIPGEWRHFDALFYANYSGDEWLTVKGENIVGSGPSTSYVFLDDIEVVQFPFCAHLCAEHRDVEVPSGAIQNAMIGNSGANFFATFKYATQVDFEVYSPDGGCLIYESHNFDAAGLIDPGYSDFAVVWNGNTNVQSSCHTGTSDVIFPDTYVIKIEAKSCGGQAFNYLGSIQVLDIWGNGAVSYPQTQNKNPPPPCCIYDIYVQNKTFNETWLYHADNNLFAGSNVDPGNPFGPVILNSGSDVRFYAGNSVTIAPGVIVQNGAHLIADIGSCGTIPVRIGKDTLRKHYEDLRANAEPINEIAQINQIQITPNPSTGKFKISVRQNNPLEIEVYSLNGEVIQKKTNVNLNTEIDLSDFADGVYIVKIFSNDGKVFQNRKIIKSR